jgi:hypothetical protein
MEDEEYVGALDADYSFLPSNFHEDEIILDRNDEPCYTCARPSQFYNLTVGRNECDLHTKSREREMI